MKLSDRDLLLLSQCAISAAFQAGRFIAAHSNCPITVKSKPGASLAAQVVTEVDHTSQDMILQALSPTFDAFDIGLLTEERADNLSRLEKDFFWCIDPLDGTLPFVESSPGYAISIALVSRAGTPHLGVIYDPLTQTLYHAIKGYGAFRNSKPWRLKATRSFTFINDQSVQLIAQFSAVLAASKHLAKEMGYATFSTILHGGAVMNACWVLENAPAFYFKCPKPQGGSLWDYAATACLFVEAGAVVCDIYGAPMDLNRASSTFMNHRGVLFASNQAIADAVMAMYVTLWRD